MVSYGFHKGYRHQCQCQHPVGPIIILVQSVPKPLSGPLVFLQGTRPMSRKKRAEDVVVDAFRKNSAIFQLPCEYIRGPLCKKKKNIIEEKPEGREFSPVEECPLQKRQSL